jgi:hypothetical protein
MLPNVAYGLKTEPDSPRVIIMTLHEEYRLLGRAAGGDG